MTECMRRVEEGLERRGECGESEGIRVKGGIGKRSRRGV